MAVTQRFVFASIVLLIGVLAAMPHEASAWTSPDAAAAARANPELATALSKEIGGTSDEAAGAAGALFGVAKSRLKADEFAQVEKAVPGMALLLKAAPAAGGATGALSQLNPSAGGLAAAAAAFSKMGLKSDMVPKVATALVSYVGKSGGANVGSLLANVLK